MLQIKIALLLVIVLFNFELNRRIYDRLEVGCSISSLFLFFMDNPLEFTPTNVMKLHAILEKLNKIHMMLLI